MSTIKDIAKLANVNIATVSRAFNKKEMVSPELYDRIMKVADELGYTPNPLAQGLKGKRMQIIAVLVPKIETSIFASEIRGVEQIAKQNGYTVIVSNTDDDPEEEKRVIEKLNNKLVDGFIVSPYYPDDQYWKDLKASGTPIVLAVREEDEGKLDSVSHDYAEAAAEATRVLFDKGCTNIFFINGSMSLKPYLQRYEGFCREMKAHGVMDIDSRVISMKDSSFELGYQHVDRLLKSGERPDGLVIASDAQTMGAMKAIKTNGLMSPDDIKVIDCAGHGISQMLETAVSVVEVSGEKIGIAAMKRLIELIESNKPLEPMQIKIDSELILREST